MPEDRYILEEVTNHRLMEHVCKMDYKAEPKDTDASENASCFYL